ncbi:MAG: hypothetical protein DRI88_09095 [Bacteroidetes bacterium]|nr:MAG: hypothetical protein DRI88_09095 [Bacteroidota bacterium]
MDIVVFDSESNGYLDVADRVHCIAVEPVGCDNEIFLPHEIEAGLSRLLEADILVCHNEIEHDIPLFLKIHGWVPRPEQVLLDTLVFSRMLHPKRAMPYGMKSKAPHSIEAWARRFDMFKVENEDWSVYTDHMGVRCRSDVSINMLILNELIKEAGYEDTPDVFYQALTGR